MASTFRIMNTNDGSSYMLQQSNASFTGMRIVRSAMACCGITTIAGFGAFRLVDFADKAALLEHLYQNNFSSRQYMFVVNKAQRGIGQYTTKDSTFALFEEIGAKLVHTADNFNMGTKKSLFFYILDIKNAIGPYLDARGNALMKEPVKAPVAEMAAAAAKATTKRPRKANGQFQSVGIPVPQAQPNPTVSDLVGAMLQQAGFPPPSPPQS